MSLKHPITPDGRYFVVRGHLWRLADSGLPLTRKDELVSELMAARRAVKHAKADDDAVAEASAHQALDQAKRALGERGPAWWKDRAPDFNRHMAKNTPYAAWYADILRSRH
jgi:hypothetical protein